jgi:excinuclease UvrABC nuclease subunit
MATLYKTRFLDPYKETANGKFKTNLPHLSSTKKQSGVYLIQSKRTGKVVYIGYSETQLYNTIYRHFQKWVDIQRAVKTRFTYSKTGYKVRVIFTTPARAATIEKYLIMKLKPRDNSLKYESYLSKQQEQLAQSDVENAIFINASDDPF